MRGLRVCWYIKGSIYRSICICFVADRVARAWHEYTIGLGLCWQFLCSWHNRAGCVMTTAVWEHTACSRYPRPVVPFTVPNGLRRFRRSVLCMYAWKDGCRFRQDHEKTSGRIISINVSKMIYLELSIKIQKHKICITIYQIRLMEEFFFLFIDRRL